jgi:hypothetical protein
VLLALLLGALGGGLVKWLGDRYSPVAVQRRRQRRLLRRLGPFLAFLPERVRDDFEVIRDGITHFDPEGLDKLLSELETQGDALARFGAAMLDLDDLLKWLAENDLPGSTPPVAVILQAATEEQTRLLTTKYPWEHPDELCTSAEKLRSLLRAIKRAVIARDTEAYQQSARKMFATDTDFADALERGTARLAADQPQYVPPPSPQRTLKASTHRSLPQFLLDNVLFITMVSAALIVMIVGYQTQFLDNKAFDGGNGDYLKLFLWAFALQVAGVTVAEVVGKLSTSASNSTSTSPSS